MPGPVEEYLKQFERPIFPEFVTEAVKMEFASKEAGRPIYEEREYVKILVVGERGFSAYEPVTEDHRKRWPQEYQAFKAAKELPLKGTPLADWPNSSVNRARVQELAFFNIRTVEELALVNDNQLQHLGMGARAQREAARKFLEVARTGTGPLEKLINENFRLKDELELKDRQLAEQASELERLRALVKESAHVQ